jgi:hypothetical protein
MVLSACVVVVLGMSVLYLSSVVGNTIRSTVTLVGTICFTSLHLSISTLLRFLLLLFPVDELGVVGVPVVLNNAATMALLNRVILYSDFYRLLVPGS